MVQSVRHLRLYGIAYCSYAIKPLQHVTGINTVSNYNTVESISLWKHGKDTVKPTMK